MPKSRPAPLRAAPPHRIVSLDMARGLIVALMALDHVRLYFSAAQFDPMDLEQTNAAWYLSRLVTHLCAPGFFFIMGLSAALLEQRTSRAETVRFLAVRGIWLILLETSAIGLAWSFNPGWFWFGVIFSLGAAMLLLAASLPYPRWLLLIAALAFIFLHNEFWPGGESPGPVQRFLYSGGMVDMPLLGPRFVLYSILPWAALAVLGWATARWLVRDGAPDARRLTAAGAAMLVLFVALRLAGYGEGWAPPFASGDPGRAILAFFAVAKYPPSLHFVLLTLGVMALVLAGFAALERRGRLKPFEPLRVYGQVPFFFYLLHLVLIHGLALATAAAAGWPTTHLFWTDGPNLIPPDGFGLGLGAILLAWLLILAILYPLCRWYARLKGARPRWWTRLL